MKERGESVAGSGDGAVVRERELVSGSASTYGSRDCGASPGDRDAGGELPWESKVVFTASWAVHQTPDPGEPEVLMKIPP